MPRLFTSTRPPPSSVAAPSPMQSLPTQKRKLTVSREVSPELALLDNDADMADLLPNSTDPGVVRVPTLPKNLSKLMDSHDLDNPYLVAAFNCLVANDNNPMRVPDILHAVQKQGWTQVLHRHKDRPEQLFGNALRAHQRRREFLGKPSLVFMIDAGGCWKHREIDLSAASGRRKGKIWCFSKEAGFACPYERLGLDLKTIQDAQYGPGGPPPPPASSSAPRKADSQGQPAPKRRKIATTATVEPAPQFLAMPKLAPATRPIVEATTLKSPQILLQPPKVQPPVTTPARASRTNVVSTSRSAATRTSSRLSTMISAPYRVSSTPELDDDDEVSSPNTSFGSYTHQSEPLELSVAYGSDSDDDADDYHVSMKKFRPSSLGLSPIKREYLEDRDMDCGASTDESLLARTPTPPPQADSTLAVGGEYDAQDMMFFGVGTGPDVMMEDPAWTWLTQAGEKNLDLLAASHALGAFAPNPEEEFPPFEEFLERRRTMTVGTNTISIKLEDLEVDLDTPAFSPAFSPLEMECSTPYESRMASPFSSSSLLLRSRESSLCSSSSFRSSSSFSVNSPLSLTPANMSTLQSSTTTTVPLFIANPGSSAEDLVMSETSFPLKSGLAHHYVTVAHSSLEEHGHDLGLLDVHSEEIKELEGLLDWDAEVSTSPSPVETLTVSTT